MTTCIRCQGKIEYVYPGWNKCPKCKLPFFIANDTKPPKFEETKKIVAMIDGTENWIKKVYKKGKAMIKEHFVNYGEL